MMNDADPDRQQPLHQEVRSMDMMDVVVHWDAERREQQMKVWRRNELLVYVANFLHNAMYLMCLGAMFDIFIFDLSQEPRILVQPDEVVAIGEGTPSPPKPISIQTHEDFEMTFMIKPSDPVLFPTDSDCAKHFACQSSVLHFTDGRGDGDCCQVGNRAPFLYFANASTRLYVDMDVVGQSEAADRTEHSKSQACAMKDELPVGEWSVIKVAMASSKSVKGKGAAVKTDKAVSLFVDGKKQCTVAGTEGKKLPTSVNMKAYLGALQQPLNPLYPSANALIQNLKYQTAGSNSAIGAMNTVHGVSTLLIAFPIGYIADRMSRYSVMRWSFLAGIPAAAILITAIVMRHFYLVVAGMIIFTVYQQGVAIALTAILADNVSQQERTRGSVNLNTSTALAMAFAPAMQFLVGLLGPKSEDVWSQETFYWLLLPGWAMLPLTMVAVFCIRPVGLQLSEIPNSDELVDPEEENPTEATASKTPRIPKTWLEEQVCCGLARRWVVVGVSSNIFLITALLSTGMTSRFFGVYFKEELSFTPANISLLNSVSRLFMAVATQLGRLMVKCMGRSNTAVALHVATAAFIAGIYGGGIGELQPPWSLACLFFLLRFATMHTRDAVLTAITMDVVPQRQRSRWMALNSIRNLGATALLGGYLADTYGYELAFNVSVLAMSVCTLIAVPVLIWLPWREGSDKLSGNEGQEQRHGSRSDSNSHWRGASSIEEGASS